ncbi:MAG: M16 family metallopeptidase [Candidatus Omnitrophota bacterium]
MKRRILLFILMISIFFVGNISLDAGIFPFQVHRKVLGNGLKIIAIPLPNPGLVAYYSVVRTGSRDEYEPGHSGFAHFFEHMMFRGTKKYSSTEYNKLTTQMGANFNAFTSNDITAYHLEFAKEDLEKVMELESDRFQHLEYAEQEFKTESGAILGELLKGKVSPFFLLMEGVQNTAFDTHTYKHTTMGFEADVRAMPTMYEYSLNFYKRYYRPENVVLMVCGDIVPETVFNLAEKYYSSWQKGYVKPDVREEAEQNAPRNASVTFKGKTLPLLCVAYKGLSYSPDSKEYLASILLGDIMFGETSDFYSRLIFEKKIAQWIDASFDASRDPFLNAITVMVKKKEDVDAVRTEIANTIKKYQTELMDGKKLDDLKKNRKYSFLLGLASTAEVASSLSRIIAITGDIDAIDRYYQTLEAVTPEDIRNAALTYFTDNRKTDILLLGEEK